MPILRKRGNPNHFGIGVTILQSKAGSSNLKSMRGEIQLAWHQSIGLHNKLSTGFTTAYVQRSLNLDGLLWDSQYNGAGVDPNLPTGEAFLNESRGYPDAGIGILWSHVAYHKFTIGYAAKHFFQNQGFLDSKEDQLILKQVLHGEWSQEVENLEIRSNGMLQKQNASYEVVVDVRAGLTIGSDSRYTTNKTSSKVIAGLGYRWADAIIGTLGYEFKKSMLCLVSYDINSSSLNSSTQMKGAWEISLTYRGWKDNQRRKLN
jgi:type IX secretion system PorP/SprF family membrane protein